MKRRSLFLASWFVTANILDVFTTHVALGLGAAEANPIMASILDTAGILGLAAMKTLVVAVMLALLAWEGRRPRHPRRRPWIHYAVIYGATATTIIASWNVAQLGLHGGLL